MCQKCIYKLKSWNQIQFSYGHNMEMVVGAPGQATKIHQQEREAEGQGRLGSGPKGLNPSFPVINRQETESKSALLSLIFFFFYLEIIVLTLQGWEYQMTVYGWGLPHSSHSTMWQFILFNFQSSSTLYFCPENYAILKSSKHWNYERTDCRRTYLQKKTKKKRKGGRLRPWHKRSSHPLPSPRGLSGLSSIVTYLGTLLGLPD